MTLWLPTVLTAALLAQDASSLYRQAVDRQRAGDLSTAIALYRQALAQDPSNIQARSNLGAALSGLGRYDDAIPEYEAALKTAPAQFQPLLARNLALAKYKSGRIEEAAADFESLRRDPSTSRDATLLAADCYLQVGEPAKAAALLTPLATGAPSDKTLAFLLGIALLKTGKTEEAQRVLDPVLKDTGSAESNMALGMAMFVAQDYPGAVRALTRARELNATLPRVNSYLGQALLFTGDPDAALQAFQQQLATDPNDFEANFQMAAIFSRRKRFAEAEPLLRRAVLLRPRSSTAHLALAETLRDEGKSADAQRELESIGAQWPKETAREETGIAVGHIALVFQLARAEGQGSLAVPSSKPSVLVFGSYSCPQFRSAAAALNELAAKYGRAASFLLIYIREAHASGQWQSTINERDHVSLAPAASSDQKRDYAVMCTRKLHMNFPAVVDGMDDAMERAYDAWPSRVYVTGADGKVIYTSRLGEFDFDRNALEAAIQRAVRP